MAIDAEHRLRQLWTQEIECGVAAGKLVRLGRTVTLHSVAGDDEKTCGAQEMIAARTELARKVVAENPGVSVATLAERCGVSFRTIYRARRASGA
jgi:hypothetical protein